MKAAIFRHFGPPSVLEVVNDFAKPSRRPGEVLIKVASASVNPIDWKTRKGEVPKFLVTMPKVRPWSHHTPLPPTFAHMHRNALLPAL